MSEHAGKAVFQVVDGKAVLDSPVDVAVIRAAKKRKCRKTLETNAGNVAHFKRRIAERGSTAGQAVIVILNVDDIHGGPLADKLMPGHNWQAIRDRGEVPYARGLAGRTGIQQVLSVFDKEAAAKLEGMTSLAVVVVDYGVAEVFAA